jgi:hypothetical protein
MLGYFMIIYWFREVVKKRAIHYLCLFLERVPERNSPSYPSRHCEISLRTVPLECVYDLAIYKREGIGYAKNSNL